MKRLAATSSAGSPSALSVLRIRVTEQRLPFSNIHSTRLFSSGLGRIVRQSPLAASAGPPWLTLDDLSLGQHLKSHFPRCPQCPGLRVTPDTIDFPAKIARGVVVGRPVPASIVMGGAGERRGGGAPRQDHPRHRRARATLPRYRHMPRIRAPTSTRTVRGVGSPLRPAAAAGQVTHSKSCSNGADMKRVREV